MFGEHSMTAAVALAICVFGGFAVLLRIALEKKRLVDRYLHVKSVMRRNEQIAQREREEEEAHQAEKDRLAHQADLLNDGVDQTVSPQQ
jgi:hypothetical protein